ncbi:NUDE protein [Peziza echinospora]|nr:NUDE protein [Peziza echinospora]
MPSIDVDSDVAEELAFYKSQVATLESELNEFQASSRELEAELEKELEASEKQHRNLRDKNESLRYEVEEWKTKYKQSKAEANTAQNALQKEVTTLREQNRAFQMRLRDMEVSNDHFETQERIVKSSLEDLETKYNVSIERGVMLEAEIHAGEAERESLRIEVQRLRDELSDMKVEVDITHEKLENALAGGGKYRGGYQSPISEDALPSTPQNHSRVGKGSSGVTSPTPPSPPISETSTTASGSSRIPTSFDPSTTPRPSHFQKTRHSRGQSAGPNTTAIPIPQSRSLHQIRGLIGQMQRLEQRVQSARSKLPAPAAASPPRASLSSSPASQQNYSPFTSGNNVTLRSQHRGRPSSNISNSSGDTAGSSSTSYGPVSRLSFGGIGDRPSSRAAAQSALGLDKLEQLGLDRPSSRSSRPSSRSSTATSVASRSSLGGSATSSLPMPKPILPRPSVAPVSRLAPNLAMSRHDYTTTMKSSARSSLPGPGDRKRSMVGPHNGGASGVTSDDENDLFDPVTPSTGFSSPARRGTIGGMAGLSLYNGPQRSNTGSIPPVPIVRSGLPRKSLGDRRVSTGSAFGGGEQSSATQPSLMSPPGSIRKKYIP